MDIETDIPVGAPPIHPDDVPHPVAPLGNDGVVTVQLVAPLAIVHD